jgi:hypothetical protein
MTRRDYFLIAEAVKSSRVSSGTLTPAEVRRWNKAVDRVSFRLSEALAQGNPRFERVPFLVNCGVEHI